MIGTTVIVVYVTWTSGWLHTPIFESYQNHLNHWLTHHTMSCSGEVAGSGSNSCLGGRTTVGMIWLWRDVSSSVASSRIWEIKKTIEQIDV